MKCALITIGNELLSGMTVNTNASWIGQELQAIGVSVHYHVTIPDDIDLIKSTLDHVAVDHRCRLRLPAAAIHPPKLLARFGRVGSQKVGARHDHLKRPLLRLIESGRHVRSRCLRPVCLPSDLAAVLVNGKQVRGRVRVTNEDNLVARHDR